MAIMHRLKWRKSRDQQSEDCPVQNEEYLAYRYRSSMALLSLLLVLLIIFLIFYFKNKRQTKSGGTPQPALSTPTAPPTPGTSGTAAPPTTAVRPRFSDLDLSQFTK